MPNSIHQIDTSSNIVRVGSKKVIFSGTTVAGVKDNPTITTIVENEILEIKFSFKETSGSQISLKFSAGEDGRHISLDISMNFDKFPCFAFTDDIIIAITKNSTYRINFAMNFVESTKGKIIVLNFMIYEEDAA